MYSHDYSEELHVKRSDKQIPISVAIIVVAVALVGVWFGYQKAEAHALAQEQALLQAK